MVEKIELLPLYYKKTHDRCIINVHDGYLEIDVIIDGAGNSFRISYNKLVEVLLR